MAGVPENEAGARPRGLLSRILRAGVREVEPLLSRRALADLASTLPSPAFAQTRTALYRAAGVTIGRESLVQGAMWITGVGNGAQLITIGDNTLITRGLHVDIGAPVRIGNYVRIGHDVAILTVNHAIGATDFRAGVRYFAEVVIEDGCWIGSRSTLLPGVVIGRGSVVAAGAVVSRSVPPDTLVAGIPARVVRELPPDGEGDRAPSVRPLPLEVLDSADGPISRWPTSHRRTASK